MRAQKIMLEHRMVLGVIMSSKSYRLELRVSTNGLH